MHGDVGVIYSFTAWNNEMKHDIISNITQKKTVVLS